MSCTTQVVTETIFSGYDNAIDVQLQDDSASPGTLANTNLTTATKVAIAIVGGNTYDSVNNSSLITYTNGGVVTMKLGSVLTSGVYYGNIIVYNPTNPNGVKWSPTITIDVQ